MLDALVEFITASWLTLYGTAAVMIAFLVSIIGGILDIAFYVLVVGGTLLLMVGLLNQLFPALLPM
jgi:maltodextrin utilization protein YvdJ